MILSRVNPPTTTNPPQIRPVVNELFDGVERIADFQATITRVQADATSKPRVLGIEYVGNKQRQADGRWVPYRGQLLPPRSRHGRVEVVVEVFELGLHYIHLYGLEDASASAPADRSRLVPFSWNVTVRGVCPASEDILSADVPRCFCKAGFFRPVGVPNARCRVCPVGKVKTEIGDDECRPCVDKNSLVLQRVDPNRRETRGPGGVFGSAHQHDQLSDCGCSTGYVMRYSSFGPQTVQADCPKATSVSTWRAPRYASRLRRYRAQCCVNGSSPHGPAWRHRPNAHHHLILGSSSSGLLSTDAANGNLLTGHGVGNQSGEDFDHDTGSAAPYEAGGAEEEEQECDMETGWAWSCVERACREEYLSSFLAHVAAHDETYGECEMCDERHALCGETHLTPVRMGVRPGWWRSNELSLDDVRECFPRASCVGAPTERPTLSEELCRIGHHGPLCASCMDGWYKGILDLCEPCEGEGYWLLLRLLPIFILLGLVLGFVLLALLRNCTRADPCRLREKLQHAQLYGRGCLYTLFGPISTRAVGLVLFSKAKIVVSMLQIQLGVIVAFDIHFPEHLMAFLSVFGALNILDLPVDCLGKITCVPPRSPICRVACPQVPLLMISSRACMPMCR